eukprot:229971-Rhodomonas_salina.4
MPGPEVVNGGTRRKDSLAKGQSLYDVITKACHVRAQTYLQAGMGPSWYAMASADVTAAVNSVSA